MFDCVHVWPLGEVWQCDLTHPDLAQPEVLSMTERVRSQRFSRQVDRQGYVASHVALRRLLAGKLDSTPQALVFATEPHGKPYLLHAPSCHFNLSHSGGCALIVISMHCQVGIDVEQVRLLRDSQGLVMRHFTLAEQRAWQSLAPAQRQQAFHQTWARKEACVKAVGWGLRLPLDAIEVGIDPALSSCELQLPSGSQVAVSVLSLSLGDTWAAALAWLDPKPDIRPVL